MGHVRNITARKLAEADTIPADYAVPCMVLESAAAHEASLAENVVRSAMHPTDEFEAFRKLAEVDGLQDFAAAVWQRFELHADRLDTGERDHWQDAFDLARGGGDTITLLVRGKVGFGEIDKVRTQLLTSALLARQDPPGLAYAIGRAVLLYGDALEADARIARLQAVRVADIQAGRLAWHTTAADLAATPEWARAVLGAAMAA